MKLMKNITKLTLIALLIVVGMSSLTSCKQEGCTDANAINYDSDADKDDGSCIYADCGCTDMAANNYDSTATCDDNSTCTYDSDQFIGSYSVSESCNSGDYDYSMTITESTQNGVTVVLTNLGNFSSITLNATVAGNNLNIPSQTRTIGSNTFIFAGGGSLNGSTLTIAYSATIDGTTDNCTATCIKI